jgi:hypothetical protein
MAMLRAVLRVGRLRAGRRARPAERPSREQADLAVGALGAGVQRRAEAGEEVFGGQIGQRRVDRLEGARLSKTALTMA